uniref:Serine aminopeptidase S33 domain-containing protein n=1 Tax=Physcomitrium patens TaxID=3218 RepID=A0A7I4BI73_PHYPA
MISACYVIRNLESCAEEFVLLVVKMAAASLTFFKEMRDSDVNKGLPTFLFGESMGGGVTFLMHFQDPKGWDGFIFASPLFKMPDLMRPTRLEIIGFSLLRRFVDTWALFPDRFKGKRVVGDPIKGATIFRNPRRYTVQASPALARCLSSPEWSTTSA